MAKKRANGEGSIRKKPSGRWEGRYTQGIDPVTGRAIQKSVSAKTQAECKEKLAKAIRENRGVPLNHTGDYTAAEWCRLWFETYSKPNIRYNTAKGYEGIIAHHIIPAIGAIKREMNNAKWTWFAIGYQCGFAYLIALMINQFGNAFTGSLNVIGLIAAIVVLAGMIYMLFKPYKEATKLSDKH